jgi:5-hmdU DNA kinase-like protein
MSAWLVSPVFDSYCKFAAEQQRIYEKRLRGESPPWTTNPTLSNILIVLVVTDRTWSSTTSLGIK